LGALGWYSSYPARAQAAGQVGTSSEPVDVFANTIDANGVNTGSVSTDVLTSDWIVDAGNHNTIQDAINHAESNNIGLVVVPPGDYNEQISIPADITVTTFRSANQSTTAPGVSLSGSYSDATVSLDGSGAGISGFRVGNSGSGVSIKIDGSGGVFTAKVENNQIRNDLEVVNGVQNAVIIGNEFSGSDLTFGSTTTGCEKAANTNIRFVTDNGDNTTINHAIVTLSSDQSIPTGTTQNLFAWDTAIDDPGSWFDSSNHSITVPRDGVYRLEHVNDWRRDADWTDGDRIRTTFDVNGSELHGMYHPAGMDTYDTPQPGTIEHVVTRPLSAGDEITISTYQTSGSSQLIDHRDTRTQLAVTSL
jgi:hypothetical protein